MTAKNCIETIATGLMRYGLIVVAGAGLYLFSAPMALADDVPTLNVAPLCRGIAAQGADPFEAGDPNVTFKQCMDSEQTDRTTVAKEWSQFSAGSRQMCTDEARTGGESSYTDLLTCLEMTRDVEQDSSPVSN
jgi:hypothetical protein